MKKYFLAIALCMFGVAFSQTKEEALLIKKTKDFYAWYKSPKCKIGKFNLYGSKSKEDAGPYFIRWKNVEKYFTYIRTSVPLLGEAFIENERKDFKELDQYYKDNPDDGIPAGFDYDRIVGGQVGVEEALEYAFPKQGRWKVIITGKTATVAWVHMGLNYETDEEEELSSVTEFKKEKGVWKISKTIGMTEIDAFKEDNSKTNTIIP